MPTCNAHITGQTTVGDRREGSAPATWRFLWPSWAWPPCTPQPPTSVSDTETQNCLGHDFIDGGSHGHEDKNT